MADIRNYTREKEKREPKKIGYKQTIARHRRKSVYRFLLLLAAFGALIALIIVQYKNHVYTSYDTIASVERKKVSGAENLRLGDSIFTYSKDGAHCADSEGVVKWNQTFEIQDVELAFCGDTVAIGEYNGRSIYVANSEGLLGQITTNMPIRDLAVAADGRVTAVLTDTDRVWINTYSSTGKHEFEGQARMDDSGYPTAISMSPSGELVGVAYMYLDAGVLKTNVAFYNFGDVGDNYSDHLASVHIYSDMVVPYVQFMNDSTAFAVGDNRMMVYSGSQKPTTLGEYLYDKEVRSVFYNERYIGLVFLADNTENRYMLEIYDTEELKSKFSIKKMYEELLVKLKIAKEDDTPDGRIGTYYFDMEYTDIFFGKNNFVIYNEAECQITTFDGVEKFNGAFSETVELMVPVGNTYKYLLITDDSIDTIQLK